MANSYFNQEFLDFFIDLSQNNNRDWFHANKKRYEEFVKDPFYRLVGDLIEEVKAREPGMEQEVKKAVFRINRDIRFSKDKSPYKLHVGAVIGRGGRKNMNIPAMYVHFSADSCHVGGGLWSPDKDLILNIRNHMASNPDKVKELVADKDFKKYFKEIKGQSNKILPKELKEPAIETPLIFRKQWYYMSDLPAETLVQKKGLVKYIMKNYEAGQAWSNFLAEAGAK